MNGDISADPYYKNQMENACRRCEYRQACQFSEEGGDSRKFLPHLKAGEVWHKMEVESSDG
jgi:ATP-dependent helicase/DNAse subunit B